MQPLGWWLLTAAVASLILVCAVLAIAAGRRVGYSTPYGSLLGLFALSYWLVLVPYVAFNVPVALGRPPRPDTAIEMLDLGAWLLQIVGLALLLRSFVTRRSRPRTLASLAVVVGTPVLFAGGYLLLAPTENVRLASALLYLILDGVCVGLVVLAAVSFRRIRNGPLGHLFLFLAVAFGLKAVGDLFWWSGAIGIADPVFLAAALVAAAGWAIHYVAVRKHRIDDHVAHPHLCSEQRVLRDAVREARGAGGIEAGVLVLATAAAVLSRHSVPHRIDGDIIQADATPAVWTEVLREVSTTIGAELGPAARARFVSIGATFGDEYAAAMRGSPA